MHVPLPPPPTSIFLLGLTPTHTPDPPPVGMSRCCKGREKRGEEKNQSNGSSLKAAFAVRDGASQVFFFFFFQARNGTHIALDARVHTCMVRNAGLLTDPSWGRHFSRQPVDMTAEAGERRATDSQDASGSGRRVTDGSFMLGPAVTTALGEERPGSAADKE